MKLYIADRKGYTREKLLKVWDGFGNIPRFADADEGDFVLRPPKTKTKKRKREASPISEDVFAEFE